MNNTARLLAVIERQFKEIDLARADTKAAHAAHIATLTERATTAERSLKEAERYIHQYQSRIGVLEHALKK